ncbi:hypothetical protein HETIRDRAFT_309422 [Heterobasidion irregulare TC 32-1]|uniref:Uncharacterized protein n=1 Tax=Heterobasidion irregulare (strain TC 32-1) TaxID=747525 RepID=W4KJH0_HETIT|nr:uncharacterized protein HETIRDRAFT_309422 [Heterobasidion irregulare TC 32-1]ETW85211.1 hypothetical protein HETIRDRAFT_309422 [Heterobasidion irregulare TC 32-1]
MRLDDLLGEKTARVGRHGTARRVRITWAQCRRRIRRGSEMRRVGISRQCGRADSRRAYVWCGSLSVSKVASVLHAVLHD